MPRDLDLLFCPEGCLFEGDHQVIAEILSLACSGPLPAGAAEKLPEDIPKEIFKAGGEVKVTSERASVAKGAMTELIVLSPLLQVSENLIGFRDLFEFLLGLFVPGVAVGMVFERELAVGLLNLFFARAALDAEHLVIILLAVQLPIPRPLLPYITRKPLSSTLKEQGPSFAEALTEFRLRMAR
jgi:hypothetical protein